MNYRDYKKFSTDHYYHIFNRGTGKMDIFIDNEDFSFFLNCLKENFFPELIAVETIVKGRNGYVKKNLPANSFSLISYCLMPNHFHFLVRQNSTIPIGKLISRVCTSYGKYFNKKYGRVGSVFQDTYKAIMVENDSYLVWLSAYIHQNPKVGGLVDNLAEYPWSSYPGYAGSNTGLFCDKKIILSQFKNYKDYCAFIESSFDKIKERKDLQNYLLD